MSWQMVQKALNNETITSPTERHVMLVLACHHNSELGCFPSVETIARETGLSERCVYKAIAQLESDKNLKRKSGGKKRGRTYSNRYDLLPEKRTRKPKPASAENSDVRIETEEAVPAATEAVRQESREGRIEGMVEEGRQIREREERERQQREENERALNAEAEKLRMMAKYPASWSTTVFINQNCSIRRDLGITLDAIHNRARELGYIQSNMGYIWGRDWKPEKTWRDMPPIFGAKDIESWAQQFLNTSDVNEARLKAIEANDIVFSGTEWVGADYKADA